MLIGVLAATLIVLVVVFQRKMPGRKVPDIIAPGSPLPAFTTSDENGKAVSSSELHGAPAVLLFVRGSWCPFCSKQVKTLAAHYQAINDSGAKLVLLTPKPLETTRRVADLFNVRFEFWLDESLQVARQLGLLMTDAVPQKYRTEYGSDTVWPTAIVTDSDGIIRHAELSRFLADRPNPEKLLGIVRALSEPRQ